MSGWIGEEYSRRSALQQAMASEVLSLLRLNGAERVLDVGCGDGKVTAEIGARLPNGSIVGVDVTPSMIEFARGHFSDAARSNIRFEVADARSLPFRNEFDLVVSFNALHWVRDQNAALRAIHEALKANGTTQLRLVGKGQRKSIEDVLEETRSSATWASYFTGFEDPYLHLTPDEYAAMAERNGFHVAKLHLADKAWDFGSREAFLAFSSANCVKWTQRVPEAERAAFLNDMLDRYQFVAADKAGEENTFKFYQMDVGLVRE